MGDNESDESSPSENLECNEIVDNLVSKHTLDELVEMVVPFTPLTKSTLRRMGKAKLAQMYLDAQPQSTEGHQLAAEGHK